MKGEKNIHKLADEELAKVGGGCEGEEPIVMQDMICENGHEWAFPLSSLYDSPEEAFECPICYTRNVRRKN